MPDRLPPVMKQHLLFLRMTANEMRNLANREPGIASELRHVAHQLDAEAEDLLKRLPDNKAPDRL